MKTFAKLLTSLFVAILAISPAFAIDAPTNVVSTSATQDSLTLSWDAVEWALYYNIYYGENKGIDILTAESLNYESENTIEISGLSAGQDYYFLLSSIDEQGDESVLTQEYMFSTAAAQQDVETQEVAMQEDNTQTQEMSSAEDFKLTQIDVLYQNEVAVLFNAPLENTPETEMIFSVTQLEDETKEYTVSGSMVNPANPNEAIVTFEENLPLDMDYKLVVISVFDQSGRNIESGIESYENFYMDPTTLEKSEDIAVVEEPVVDDGTQEDNQPVVDDNQSGVDTGSNTTDSQDTNNPQGDLNAAGDNTEPVVQEVSEPIQDVAGAADDMDTLPQTGPAHILMLLLALAFGGMAVAFRFKK